MNTPPLYFVAKYFPHKLFNIYLNWAIDNEKKWNGLDRQKGHLTSRYQQTFIEAPPLSPERKDGIYASYVKSTRKTIPDYNKFVFESGQDFTTQYFGGVFKRTGDSLIFIKNGIYVKRDIAETMMIDKVIWPHVMEDMFADWEVERSKVLDYAVALGNELRK